MKTLLLSTDSQLVHEFKDGNNSALEILIWRYKEKMFSTILFLVKDKYLAEDLFQDAFIKIIDTIRSNRYKEEGKFLPWAIRITHNLCVDHFRKVKRAPAVKTTDDQNLFEMYNFREESADQRLIQNQTQERVSQ